LNDAANAPSTRAWDDGVIKERPAQYYVMIPGKENLQGDDAYKKQWAYVGEGKVYATKADADGETLPATAGDLKDIPDAFPELDVKGTPYTYDKNGTHEDYTYTVAWDNLIDSNGYNIGEKAYDTGKGWWHVNGHAILVTPNMYNVGFFVRQPGSADF